MRALVTGATGFIGRRLLEEIAQPVVLSRDPARARAQRSGVEAHAWDPLADVPPSASFEGVEAVFHLAGESVGEGRWTAAKKQRIRDSRVVGTANLVRALAALDRRPRVLVSASAIGYYGSRGDEVLDETSAPADDFLADVCRAWEAAAMAAENHGVRAVCARFGVVLGPGGGALKKMLFPFRLGLGGRLGSGRQWMSWVHVDDVVGILLHAAKNENLRGPINAVSPAPVTNREFTRVLAGALHRPAVFPVPALGLRLAVGEFAEVLLGSQRVMPSVAQREGYAFRYPTLEGALAAAVRGPKTGV
ncbi:MAG: TIGR01777 family protein [Planctomycetia bacterium]|nr:TIGR01777 family protein [Planctomycetia bacterium]